MGYTQRDMCCWLYVEPQAQVKDLEAANVGLRMQMAQDGQAAAYGQLLQGWGVSCEA